MGFPEMHTPPGFQREMSRDAGVKVSRQRVVRLPLD